MYIAGVNKMTGTVSSVRVACMTIGALLLLMRFTAWVLDWWIDIGDRHYGMLYNYPCTTTSCKVGVGFANLFFMLGFATPMLLVGLGDGAFKMSYFCCISTLCDTIVMLIFVSMQPMFQVSQNGSVVAASSSVTVWGPSYILFWVVFYLTVIVAISAIFISPQTLIKTGQKIVQKTKEIKKRVLNPKEK